MAAVVVEVVKEEYVAVVKIVETGVVVRDS